MTKKLFVPAYKKSEINPDFILKQLEKVPKPFFLTYSIQFKEIVELIKKSYNKKDLTGFSQVLGCSRPKIPENSDTKAILLIGSGRFHGVSLSLETNLQVYVLEPGSDKLSLIEEKEIQKLKQIQKSSYTKFLNSKSIGILVSLKPGQNKLQKALELQKNLEKSDKESYIFIANNINLDETQNFHGIDSWINTACPRLSLDKTDIININEINKN
ncbi:MAG: diphthamide synthesis protein [Nanoarchaeota archaeon]